MKSPLPGVKVLLMGASGSGKTTAIETLIAKGITPFCIFTEPGFEVLGHVPADKLHWHYVRPSSQNWSSMVSTAKQINMLSFEALSKVTDPNKGQYTQFVELLTALNNFVCDRDGKAYGDVCTWGTDRAVVIDGLTGVGTMAMNLHIGGKPLRHQGEWAIGMLQVENLMGKLCTDTQSHFVLISHTEREVDEVQGGSRIMAATLGRKLAPKLPRHFSDVVLADKAGTRYSWSTAAAGADTKARNLPTQDGLPPDFGPIIESWKKQGGIITSEV